MNKGDLYYCLKRYHRPYITHGASGSHYIMKGQILRYADHEEAIFWVLDEYSGENKVPYAEIRSTYCEFCNK